MFKPKIIFQFLFLILFNFCDAQKSNSFKIIKTILESADSVIIISHVLTEEYSRPVYDWDTNDTSMTLEKKRGTLPVSHKFISQGKINPAIITESKRVSTKKTILIDILAKSQKSENSNKISCDMPHHSIIIYKNGKQSYLDICFTCRKVHTSKDIKFFETDFDNRKWNRLKLFFQNAGIKKYL